MSYAIFTLARAHRAHAARLLRDLGLHPGQELLLMQLLDEDGQTQSELLASAGIDHSTVSKSLSRMQQAGLLTREPTAEDRRVLRVWLTDAGRDLRGPLQEMWSTLEATAEAGLSPQQVSTFIATSRTIEQSISTRGTPQARSAPMSSTSSTGSPPTGGRRSGDPHR